MPRLKIQLCSSCPGFGLVLPLLDILIESVNSLLLKDRLLLAQCSTSVGVGDFCLK